MCHASWDAARRQTGAIALSTRRSLVFSFLDRYASLAVGIASSMLLARLLTPSEVGVFSVAMALLAMVQTVRDLGAGQYLLQEKELTPDRIRAVWSVQLGLGILLGVIVVSLSQPVAAFYREPRMRDIMLLLALSYLINPFGSVTYAWLMREMRYDAIAVIRFSATIAGAFTSVILAQAGHGPISLAWGSLCTTAVNAGVSVMFRPHGYPWMPGLREIGRVLSFGTRLTSTSIITTVSTGAPEFLLGRLQNLTAAGYFSRANGLVAMLDRLITDAIYGVALSLFSKEAREARDSGASLLKAMAYITALSWSFSLTLIFLAHPAIRLLYGTQWDQSVDLARLLAAAMVFMAPIPLCSAALIGAGAVSKVFKAAIISAAFTIALAAVGALLGLLEIGTSLLAAAVLSAMAWLTITRNVVHFAWQDLWQTVCQSSLVAAASASAPALVFAVWGARPANSMAPLVFGIIGSAAGFVLGLKLARHGLLDEVARLLPGIKAFLRSGRVH
jgi:O-antigen/teichoic acid export membrane protein